MMLFIKRQVLSQFAIAIACMVGASVACGQPATYYLDVNGTTAGFGAPTGTIVVNGSAANAFWSTSSAGTNTTVILAGGTTVSNWAFGFDGTSGISGDTFAINLAESRLVRNISVNVPATVTLQNSNNSNIQVNGSSTWTVAAGATLTQAVVFNSGGMNYGSNNLALNGAGTINFNSSVGFNSNSSGTTTQNMAGTVNFRSGWTGGGANQGNYTLTAGTLNFATGSSATVFNSSASNARVFSINGGSLDNTSGAPITLTSGTATRLSIGGNFTFLGSNAFNTGTSAVALGAVQRSITVNASTLTLGGPVGGAGGGVTKLGAGQLVLNGANTYTGDTSIQSGTLQIGAGGSTGSLSTSSAITVSSNATLAFNRSNTLTQGTDFNAVIAGAGNLVQAGAGTLILNGANTYTGATSIQSGTLQIGAGGSTGSLSTSSAITVSSNATLAFNRSNTLTQGTDFNAVITGAGNLVQAGAGTLILNGANTYTGATTISAGVLRSGAANVLADSTAVTVGGGVLDLDSFGDTVGSVTLTSGSITGSGKLTAATYGLGGGTVAANLGAGTLTVTGNATLNGTSDATTVNLNAGGLVLGGGNRFTAASVAVTGSSGASLTLGGNESFGSLAGAADIALGGNTLAVGSAGGSTSYAGALSNGALTKTGAGTLILNGANTYTGATSIQSGTLQIGAGGSTGSLSTSSAITVSSNATLAFNRSNTLTQGTDFNAVITGAGNLVQAGAGTLILNGANTYTGATTISAGVLALGANGSFANSSTIKVGDAGSSNAALDLTAKTAAFALGAGQTLSGGGTVLVAPGQQFEVQGTFAPGNSPGLFTFDGGTTALSGTTVMEIFGTSRATSPSHGSGFYDAVNIVDNGVLQLGGMLTLEFASLFDDATAFDLFSPASGSSLAGTFSGVNVIGSFYTGLSWSQTGSTWKSSNTVAGQSLEFNATSGQLVIVPEPAGFVLAMAGVLIVSVGFSRRRRR